MHNNTAETQDQAALYALIKKAAAGDRQSEAEVLALLEPKIQLARMKSCTYDANGYEDMMQEGRLFCITLLRRYDPERNANFCAWIYMNLRHRFIDMGRRRASEKRMTDALLERAELFAEASSPAVYEELPAWKRLSVEEVLRCPVLTPEGRTALRMKAGGATLAEIAAETGAAVSTVHKRLTVLYGAIRSWYEQKDVPSHTRLRLKTNDKRLSYHYPYEIVHEAPRLR